MAASDRRLRANRANAARSTGPRTKAGKAATRLNALRHGLAASSHYQAGADREIETLARAIVGAQEGSELLALARRVAGAELRLRRVRSAQMFLVNTARRLEDFRADSSGVVHGASPQHSVTPVRSLGKDFEAGALDRYERRARSRRKFAIRDYDAARTALVALQRPIEN
jgi:hypothetical protein